MADILYIDCNRNQSVKSDENTNEWEFVLQDEALVLPAGTQVSIQESFINKRGVSGNTIEIEEDMTTTIRYSYYLSHSPHFVPEAEQRPDTSTNRLFTSSFFNISKGNNYSVFPRDSLDDRVVETKPAVDYFDSQMSKCGGYEKPLMACKISRYENTTGAVPQDWAGDLGTIEPLIGTTEITIPAGAYGVDEIAKLIEDQLTGRLTNVKNKDFSENFIEKKKKEGTYRGTLENDTTLIMSTCMPFTLTDGFTGAARSDITNGRKQFPVGQNQDPPFKLPLYGEIHGTQPAHDPDSVDDRFRPLFFMKPSDWNDCRDTHMIVNEWNNGDFYPVDRVGGRPPIGADRIAAYLKRSDVWNYTKQSLDFRRTTADEVNSKCLFHHFRNVDYSQKGTLQSYNYDTQNKGIYVGAPDIKFGWDSTNSAFAIGNLHFPYRFMSHDQHGNVVPEAGQEGIMMRRLNVSKRLNNAVPPEEVSHIELEDFETPLTRVGGISIFNWDVETAQKEGDVDYKDGAIWSQVASSQGMWSFEDHFTSKEGATRAWNKTLWAKLGFTYDQLQNRDNYEMANYLEEAPTNNKRLFGTTTRPDINSSITSSISSAFNIASLQVGSEAVKPRVYSNLDVGTTFGNSRPDATNNPFPLMNGQGSPFSNLGSYFSSPFSESTTVNVLTQGRPIIAQSLPTLSEEGYFLITSNIVDGYKDRVKRGTPISLLGIVPISNLSNQDFIQSRNDIVHTIQNTTVLNSIKIKVLKPDLTAPRLQDSSSVILKIVRPLQQGQGLIGDLGQTKEEDKHTDEKKSSLQKKKF